MNTVTIPETDICVSRLIFGTASLFSAGGYARRQRVLEAAVENGFTHFDTAPYYGFGMAERDLGGILRKHPRLTVTTKVGLYAPGGEEQSSLSILLRKAGGRFVSALSKPDVDFGVRRAQLSLEGSLRRLVRDCIDLYMLHEPRFELLETDEWLKWLEITQTSGRIRHYGLALAGDRLLPFLRAKSPLTKLVQTFDSLENQEANILTAHGKPLQITFGYVSSARSNGNLTAARDLLLRALQRNAHGAIIVSTRQRERMNQYSQLFTLIK